MLRHICSLVDVYSMKRALWHSAHRTDAGGKNRKFGMLCTWLDRWIHGENPQNTWTPHMAFPRPLQLMA